MKWTKMEVVKGFRFGGDGCDEEIHLMLLRLERLFEGRSHRVVLCEPGVQTRQNLMAFSFGEGYLCIQMAYVEGGPRIRVREVIWKSSNYA